MKALMLSTTLALLLPASACSQDAIPPRDLLDRLTGDWLLQGMIAGDPVTHDVTARWVLEGGYLQLHELAREKDETGRPAYEAIVIIAWEETAGEYQCLWLDTTGNTAFTGEVVIGRAEPSGNDIPFVFTDAEGGRFFNTFSYDEADDTWRWVLNSERDGELVLFADVTLQRQP